MYSHWQLAKKYAGYYLRAANARGHGMHSPFVFDFIIHVLNGKANHPSFFLIEKYRKRLLNDDRKIFMEDFGAGSAVTKNNERKISEIARSSLKSKKYASLLFRLCQYYQCKNIIELGTSLGTTTAYLALSSPDCRVITLEGAEKVADIAEDFFEHTNFNNIRLIRGPFEKTLTGLLNKVPQTDLVFIDGNHQEEPTIRYLNLFLKNAHNDTILIFDDIHWSIEMESAWQKIKEHPEVTLTIDLFFMGLAFLKKEFLVKQHFEVRF